MKESPVSPKGATEGRILATAAARFALFGYNGVSTRDIASGAGVNEVTIYRHYPRKRNLYLAVLDSELGKVSLHGDLLARIAEAGDGRTALARTFELIVKALTSSPEFLRLLQYGALEVSDDLDPLLRKHLAEPVKVISRYLEPWIVALRQCRSLGPDADCHRSLPSTLASAIPFRGLRSGEDVRVLRGNLCRLRCYDEPKVVDSRGFANARMRNYLDAAM